MFTEEELRMLERAMLEYFRHQNDHVKLIKLNFDNWERAHGPLTEGELKRHRKRIAEEEQELEKAHLLHEKTYAEQIKLERQQ